MKKIITLSLLVFAAAQIAGAQKLPGKLEKTGKALFTHGVAQKQASVVSSTLFPESFGPNSACTNSIYVYFQDSVGYFAGVDWFGDKEILMRYYLPTYKLALPATVDTVQAFFGVKYLRSNGNIRAKVYAADVSGAPGTLLGTSNNVSVSAVDTTGDVTSFVFANPVALTGSLFFVSIDISSLYASGDSVGLFSTDETCPSTNPDDAWTKTYDDKFLKYSDPNNWNSQADIGIFAHVKAHTVGVSSMTANAFGASAYPVPASNELVIAFTGRENGNVNVLLKDITGKSVASVNMQSVTGGSYKVPFDVKALSSGIYFVELSSGSSKSVLRVAVQ